MRENRPKDNLRDKPPDWIGFTGAESPAHAQRKSVFGDCPSWFCRSSAVSHHRPAAAVCQLALRAHWRAAAGFQHSCAPDHFL